MRRVAILVVVALLGACARAGPIRYPQGGETLPDCPRGRPTPILNPRGRAMLAVTFRSRGYARAVETARLGDGISLLIEHQGCRHIGHIFRFQLRATERPLADRRYWYTRAAQLMGRLEGRGSSGEGLDRMARFLRGAAAASPPPPYGRVLRMGEFQNLRLRMKMKRNGPEIVIRFDFTR